MSIDAEVIAAAQRILAGDDSKVAAAALEGALHAHYPNETDLDDLLETLALYEPSMGSPYVDFRQLCDAIRKSRIFEDEEADG